MDKDRKDLLKAGWMLGSVTGGSPLFGLLVGSLPYIFPKAANRLLDGVADNEPPEHRIDEEQLQRNIQLSRANKLTLWQQLGSLFGR